MAIDYDEYLQNKEAKKRLASEIESGGILDESGPIPSGVVESKKMSQSEFDAASRQPGGANAGLNTAADAAMMFGGPKGMAIGLGLKTLQSVNQAKQQQRMNKYNAEVQRIQARQDAINRLAQIGQGLKA